MLRSFTPAAQGIAEALASARRVIDSEAILPDAPIHAGTGALAMMMAVPPRAPSQAHAVNALLDVAFDSLHQMGNEAYAALLKDEMEPAQFITFLRQAAQRYPRVYGEVFARLGAFATGRWGFNLLRSRLRSAA
jgi:lycopene cyclase CruA